MGGFDLTVDGCAAELPTRKIKLLLAILAMPDGASHPRDRLASLLWPNSQEDQARGSLRHALAALRTVLGAAVIQSDRDTVLLTPQMLTLDTARLSEAAGTGPVLKQEEVDPLCAGELLAGFEVDGQEGSEWLQLERKRCQSLLEIALERRIKQLEGDGRIAQAMALAQRLTNLDPLRERHHRLLMRLHNADGERAKALEQFQRCRDVLASELAVSPSPKTTALARAIQSGADDPAAPQPNDAGQSMADDQGLAPPRSVPASGTGVISMAVLPFTALGDDAQIGLFAEGMAADLTSELSCRREFSVIAWPSSRQVSGQPEQAAQSAIDLGARYGLTGTIRRGGERLRINAQLVAAATQSWVWAERFDCTISEMFDVQDAIVARVIGSVDAGVRQAEREVAAQRKLESLDSWGLCHRGMWHMVRFTAEDTSAAEALFEQARSLAPGSADPHSGLAYAAIVRSLWNFSDDLDATLARGLDHAQTAVRLAPGDAQAQTMLGRLLLATGRISEAQQHLAIAIEVNPSYAHAHYALAQALYRTGHPTEALATIAQALMLSPKDPLMGMFLTMKAFCHLSLGDAGAAEMTARRAVSQQRSVWSRLALAASLQAQGRPEDAAVVLAEARAIDPKLTFKRIRPLVSGVASNVRDGINAALKQAGFD
jgi:DNA-binding SARP family transcriptional activator/TolB-like protein/Flp pilus assembly protein TadD